VAGCQLLSASLGCVPHSCNCPLLLEASLALQQCLTSTSKTLDSAQAVHCLAQDAPGVLLLSWHGCITDEVAAVRLQVLWHADQRRPHQAGGTLQGVHLGLVSTADSALTRRHSVGVLTHSLDPSDRPAQQLST